MREISANSVLLVDDDPSIREFLSMQLEEAGFKAQQAEDGIDGLVKLRDTLPKVIISDLRMPRMTGIEFISVVRRRFPSIPVIVLSGLVTSEFPAGAQPDCCFEKTPQQIPELLQAVRTLARKAPDRVDFPQVVRTPVRTHPDSAGHLVLTCTDCLRLFQVMRLPEHHTEERTVPCSHCDARVPFIIEGSHAA